MIHHLISREQYYTASSYSSGIFTGLGDVTFDDGSNGTINVDWPDAIKCTNGSEICFKFKNVAESNGVGRYSIFRPSSPNGTKAGKLVYLTFPFETILSGGKKSRNHEEDNGFF